MIQNSVLYCFVLRQSETRRRMLCSMYVVLYALCRSRIYLHGNKVVPDAMGAERVP